MAVNMERGESGGILVDLARGGDDRGRAVRLIVRRARAYKLDGGRLYTLKLHSIDKPEVELLAAQFGGNFYAHGNGWQWSTSNRYTLARVRAEITPYMTDTARKRLAPLFELEGPAGMP